MNYTPILLFAMLVTSSCGRSVQEAWKDIPLSDGIDLAQFRSQAKAAPGRWNAAAEFLKRPDLKTLPSGRYDLDEDGTYAMVQEYQTKETNGFEYHRKFIDIQYVISGSEYIDVSSLQDLAEETKAYSETNDCGFWARSEKPRRLLADPNHCVLLFPSDGHAPSISIDPKNPSTVRKVVIKVPFAEPVK